MIMAAVGQAAEGADQPATTNPPAATESTAPSITVTAPSTAKTPSGGTQDSRDVVKRLESGGRILSLIKKAETKRVAKRKIITFLKKKGVSESKIIEAYSQYYKEEGLYEITFNQRPLGFSVIMDTRGKNAIVSSVQDETNGKLGMKIASRVYEINGKRVDDMKHKEILKLMAQQPTPFYVVFKESRKKNSKLKKRQQRIEKGLQWRAEDDDDIDELAGDSESSGSDSSGYDSDDFDAHVDQHYRRKQKSGALAKKKKRKKGHNAGSSLFKPHEMDEWDDNQLVDEQAAMLKQLSALMMDAVSHADLKNHSGDADAGGAAVELKGVDGMTHKRANTLKAMVDMTASPDSAVGHQVKESMRKVSVGDLAQSLDIESEYDPEIFKYLSELVTGGQERKPSHVPLTPSTSRLMRDLFVDAAGDEDISLNLPDSFGAHAANSSSGSHGFPNANFAAMGGGHKPQYSGSMSQASSVSDLKEKDDDKDDEDVIESLEQGATLLKYGKYGKPKFKMFHLTPDHKYLVWFSQKKSSEETRIRIKEIRKIAIGSESKVVEKTKKKDVQETSFTIFYGKANNEKHWKSLTVTAKNPKEAFVWAQGLKILSDASKQGKHIRTLSKNVLPANASATASDPSDPLGRRKHFAKTESVIISMDQLQSKSVMNLFSKSSAATATSLLKQHAKHKQQLQKCVDFVMTKANYRAIAAAGQFDKVKLKLEDLDNRLRDTKTKLTTNDDLASDLSAVKAELYSCAADLDALKQKLTAIVRRPQKL